MGTSRPPGHGIPGNVRLLPSVIMDEHDGEQASAEAMHRVSTPGTILIRDAIPEDWPAIWPFMREIVEAGETFSWDTQTSEADARAGWFRHGRATSGCTSCTSAPRRRNGGS